MDVVPLQPTNIWDNGLAALQHFGQIHVNIVQKATKCFRTILAFTVQIIVPKAAKIEATSDTYSETYGVESTVTSRPHNNNNNSTSTTNINNINKFKNTTGKSSTAPLWLIIFIAWAVFSISSASADQRNWSCYFRKSGASQGMCCVGFGKNKWCHFFCFSKSTAIASSFLQTLVFCTWQLYYELLQEHEMLGRMNVALVRGDQRTSASEYFKRPKEESSDDGTTVAWKQQHWCRFGQW